ncbi:MAG TPA: urate hydroxylase PuuD [Steroidobacteraceae bacterium]|nr:urate hydroxylase PuuD [Steroidobacteraceae bacterium]
MIDYLLDWCGLLVRWLHVVAGIAWIGSSFYFVWLDNHLEPQGASEPIDPNVAGELWAVHGGGFYRSRKYRVAPAVLPPTLHWFYWEAYTTWLSGFGLLFLLYFLRAEAYLIDPSVLALTKSAAIAITLAVLVVSWLVYDGLCRSPLGRNGRALALAVALVTAVEAWGVCHLFGGRGAFMVFGAALGTIMVANVLFVIIPGQRELVRAKREGREPDPGPGLRGKQRSVHNTYFTLPVIFVMISNHYAMTYGARYNWLVLIAMSFAGACIRGWFVARHKPAGRRGAASALPAALGVLTLVGVVVALAPESGPSPLGAALGLGDGTGMGPAANAEPNSGAGPNSGATSNSGASASTAPPGDVAQVQSIVEKRCVPCHSTHPSSQFGFNAPPNGVVLETLDQLRAHLPEVQKQVSLRTMPLGNLTGMTDTERATVLMWIGHGAAGRAP